MFVSLLDITNKKWPVINEFGFNKRAVNALLSIKKYVPSINDKLNALVELLSLNINRCAYCVKLHSKELSAAGEYQNWLDWLAV